MVLLLNLHAITGSHLVWSEASCSVMRALQEFHLSENFVCKILLLLAKTGFSIKKDTYCKDVDESYRHKSDLKNKNVGSYSLQDIFHEFSVGNFSMLFKITNYSELNRIKTVQPLKENSFDVNSLLAKCRIRIRNRLSLVNHRRALGPLIEKLPLPIQLLKYLMLDY